MNWLAAALVVICAALAGQGLTDRLRRRTELLGLTVRFLDTAISSVSYSLIPPDRIIGDFSCPDGSFFGICRAEVQKGKDIRAAWHLAAAECGDVNALLAEEKELLCQLGDSLGAYAAQGQIAVLERHSAIFSAAYEQARQERRQRSQMYISCSLLTGMLVALIII